MSRNQEQRHITYDHDLGIEAYQLSGVVQKFPNHFHDFYVIGFIEGGQRHLWCKGREYDLRPGDLILFNPRDNHYCSPIGGELLDYRALNIKSEVMLKAAKEITGKDHVPCFMQNVVCQSEAASSVGEVYDAILADAPRLQKEEAFFYLLEQVLQEYTAPFESLEPTEPNEQIRKLCTYMERHYAENISLDTLLSMTSFGKTYLLRSFTKQLGVSPYRYLQTIRIDRAKKLLEQGVEPIEAAGLCGITLYYLLENIALTLTLASNVGVIISIAPFFTAMFAWLFLHDRRPGGRFFLGFLMAMAGIALLSFGKDDGLQLNPIGDLLGVAAAVIWAAYSILTKKISGFGYDTILTTRRIFFYGLVFMVPISFAMGVHVELRDFAVAGVLPNLLFLGLGASALCFVTWNTAVKHLGSVKTSVYIYMVPVITAVTSALILHETLTVTAVCGIVLTLAGLFLSEKRVRNKEDFTYGIERK